MDRQKAMVFLHIPKTGGSTINYLLRRSFGNAHVDVIPLGGRGAVVGRDDLALVASLSRNRKICSLAGHGFRITTDFSGSPFDPQWFTFIRNPVSRALSAYQYRVEKRNRSAADPVKWFRKERFWNWQTRRIAGEANLDRAIGVIEEEFRFVGLVERFDESLYQLRAAFSGFPLDVHYMRRNVAKDSLLKQELRSRSELMELLQESNQLDLELCRYVEKKYLPGTSRKEKVEPLEISRSFPSYRVLSNRIKRNVIYKPAVRMARSGLMTRCRRDI